MFGCPSVGMAEREYSFLCDSDQDFEEIYYYRWWAFRKHLKQTPKGFVFTEFLKPVNHATEYNAVSCAFGHHVYEARWLQEQKPVDQYINFWLRSGENGGLQPKFQQFSGWAANALYNRYLVTPDKEFLTGSLKALLLDYQNWEKNRLLPSGLFWQYDVADGMEESISGGRRVKNPRPTINSYMYGNAAAIANIARLADRNDIAREYDQKASRIKTLLESRLWDGEAKFFKTMFENGKLADVREQIGFTPWYFNLPSHGKNYEIAWKQLTDKQGFSAPFGLTTAEQRHPEFKISLEGDDCQWNGPVWAFSTTVTLKALANLLHNYRQNTISKEDYFETLQTYTKSQRLQLPDETWAPFIDENLDPFTGEWLARKIKIMEKTYYGRRDHYNHSGYADAVISQLIGLIPRADQIIEIKPLLPEGKWDWFALDNISYHGKKLTIIWDKPGSKYKRGKGLTLFIDGEKVAAAEDLRGLTYKLK